MIRRPSLILLALAALAAAATLSACGKRSSTATAPRATTQVNVVLDYFPNADHVGLYQALADGEFARAGLDVRPQAPADAASPLKLLIAGRADLAISYEPELLLARDKGAKLVAVGALVQRPLTSIISLDRRITRPSQLRGAKVGTAGIPYQSEFLKTILQRAAVDPASVKEVNVGFNLVPAMVSRKVDATLGGFWNYEGIQLTRARKRPAVIPVDRAGVPTYNELVLVARTDYARDHGATIRRFIQALARGTEAVRQDPATGVDNLVKANPDLDRGLQLAAVKATLPVFFPADASLPFGWQSGAQWRAFSAWMLARGLLTRRASAASFTNEFLPGEGL